MYRRAQDPDKYLQTTTHPVTCTNKQIWFAIPWPTSVKYKKFPMYRGVQLWNTLPAVMRKLPSYEHKYKYSIPKPANFENSLAASWPGLVCYIAGTNLYPHMLSNPDHVPPPPPPRFHIYRRCGQEPVLGLGAFSCRDSPENCLLSGVYMLMSRKWNQPN